MNWRLLVVCIVGALVAIAGSVLLAIEIGSPAVGWFIGWATAIIFRYVDGIVTTHLRDSDGTATAAVCGDIPAPKGCQARLSPSPSPSPAAGR